MDDKNNKTKLITKKVTKFFFFTLIVSVVIFIIGGIFLADTKYFNQFFNIIVGSIVVLLVLSFLLLFFTKLFTVLKRVNIYGKIWFLSILIFIVGLFGLFDNHPNGGAFFFSTILIGIVSFIFWLLSIVADKISGRFQKVSSSSLIVIRIIFSLIVAYALIYTFVFRFIQIGGDRMHGYQNGSYYPFCVICKDFKREDVVAYAAYKYNVLYIGRIIGLPNESITIEKNKIFINGQLINEPYANWSDWQEDNNISLKLNADEYFILFDKRSITKGERKPIGNGRVKKGYIIGTFIH